ncbi:hypothetical protein HALA3H3_660047 [Halomonas sp. A3H3]|nr:hypothetical protein HALA3H3_660047 [Halomonas sp. A3H3]
MGLDKTSFSSVMVRQIESGGHPAKGVARVQRALIAARMSRLIAPRFNFAFFLQQGITVMIFSRLFQKLPISGLMTPP